MTEIAQANVSAAGEYAAKHSLHALLIARDGEVVHEEYAGGFDGAKAHALYSGTKSFWGTAALCAVEDGLFTLDEPVAGVVPEFKNDIRRNITPRMLLTMTAGYGFGGLGSAVPTYDKALEIPLKNRPGETFTYGGIPLQVFGAFFARVLGGETPHRYLARRVLESAGVDIAEWRTLKDATHPLPTGVQLRARSWLAYGTFMLERHARFVEALHGTAANARYGLCWWLTPPGVKDDVFYASGSAGQGLYIVPARKLAVVHFAKSTSYKHDAFLKKLLS